MTERSHSDDTLRELFQSPEEGHGPGEDCPPPGRILDALRGEIPAGETRELVDHVAVCACCTEVWCMAREFAESGRETELQAPEPVALPARRSSPRGRWIGLAAAATLAIVMIGLGILELREPREAPARIRAEEGTAIRSLVAENEPLPRARCLLRWTPVGVGARYQIRVATERLIPLASEGGLESVEYTVAEQDLAGLPPGSVILWQVRASLADGRRIASETFVNRIQ